MSIETAEMIWIAVAAYLGLGGVFAILFVWRGVGAIDESARGASAIFRLAILPGAALLWPLMLMRTLFGPKPSNDAAPSS